MSFGQTKGETGGEIAMFRVRRTLDGDFRKSLQVEDSRIPGINQSGPDFLNDQVSVDWGGSHVDIQPGRV